MGYLATSLMLKTAGDNSNPTAAVDTASNTIPPPVPSSVSKNPASKKTSVYEGGSALPTNAKGEVDNSVITTMNKGRLHNKYVKDAQADANKNMDLGKIKSADELKNEYTKRTTDYMTKDVESHKGSTMSEIGNAITGKASPAETYARELEANRDSYSKLTPQQKKEMRDRGGYNKMDVKKMSPELKKDMEAKANTSLDAPGWLKQQFIMDSSVNEQNNPSQYVNNRVAESVYGGTAKNPGYSQGATKEMAGIGDRTKQVVQQKRDAAFNKYAPWVAGGLGLLGGMGLMSMMNNMGGQQQPQQQQTQVNPMVSNWAKSKNWGNYGRR